MKPLCFVVMPFGQKPDEGGRVIDFDAVYARLIEPAIRDAGLEPLRADHEKGGGIIHQAMFERLMLCDIALADLTIANANVYYELGVRHGVRPHSTVLISAIGSRLPFDLGPVRCQGYALGERGELADVEADKAAISARLAACLDPVDDSPLFQLVSAWPRPDVARLKTDRFRELVDYSTALKTRLDTATRAGTREAVAAVEADIDLGRVEPAVIVDLMLSYREVGAHGDMVRLAETMPGMLRRTVLVREQLGFALNREKRRDEAEAVLQEVIREHGPSSETNGLLGRVYKDRWQEAGKTGDAMSARIYLRKAIASYLEGFEADWRDAYPGINAVTLMEMADPVDPRQSVILPVVDYALKRRLAGKKADYWDHATRLELAILGRKPEEAAVALEDALATVPAGWKAKSTAGNLALIRQARERRGEEASWIASVESELLLWAGRTAS